MRRTIGRMLEGVGIAFICAGATAVIRAQDARPADAGSADRQDLAITAVGCLQRGAAAMTSDTTEAQAPAGARTRASGVENTGAAPIPFVLAHARVNEATSRPPASAEASPNPSAPDRRGGKESPQASGSERSGSASAATGSDPATRIAASGDMFQIIGLPEDDLGKLLGHQVEVRGRLANATRGMAAGDDPRTTMRGTGTATATPPTNSGTMGSTQTGRGERSAAAWGATESSARQLPTIQASSIRDLAATCSGS